MIERTYSSSTLLNLNNLVFCYHVGVLSYHIEIEASWELDLATKIILTSIHKKNREKNRD